MKKMLLAIAIALVVTTPSYSMERVITSSSYFGCAQKSDYQELIEYVADNDRAAFEEGLIGKIMQGRCIMLKKGMRVYLQDTALFSGMVKLRLKGRSISVWTAMEAIQ